MAKNRIRTGILGLHNSIITIIIIKTEITGNFSINLKCKYCYTKPW